MEEVSFIIRVSADEFDKIQELYESGRVPTQQERDRLEVIVEYYEAGALIVIPSKAFITRREQDTFYKYRPALHAVDSVPSCYLCAREILKRK